MYSLQTPITGKSKSNGRLGSYTTNLPSDNKVHEYLKHLRFLCLAADLDPNILTAQSYLETDGWTSYHWKRGNPAGIGITDSGPQDEPIWSDPQVSALIHVIHMCAYVYGAVPSKLAAYAYLDTRWRYVKDRKDFFGKIRTIGDLGAGVWATDRRYAEKIVGILNQFGMTRDEGGLKMVQIRTSLIPVGLGNRPRTKIASGDLWITVHETGNTSFGADARSEENFARSGGGPDRVSYHFAVDDKEAVQLLPLDEIGWHAGDGCDNIGSDTGCFRSVAIETCVGKGLNWSKVRDNLAQLIAAIAATDARIDWGSGSTRGRFSIERIAQHNWWSGKDCPHYIRAEGFWPTLMRMVDGYAKPPVVTPPSPYADPLSFPKWGGMDVLHKGNLWWAINRSIEVVNETPRLAWGAATAKRSGPDLGPGDSLNVRWYVKGSDGYYWVSDKGHRIAAKDVFPKVTFKKEVL